MTLTSGDSPGTILFSTWCGGWVSPIISGMFGPWMSASSSPTLAPVWRSATARPTAQVDLPTPPLPAPTATTFLTPGSWIVLQLADVVAGLLQEAVLDRAGRGGQLEVERDAAALDLEVLDEPEGDDVLVQV